ncbi:MAG: phosphatidylserine decarboxylase [Sedimentisphaerales bacterium]|nr:phosphatidylserine decarboxylase [Sedimentisphaerales bacterium]
MRIPLTKYGWPQMVIVPAIVLLGMVVFAVAARASLPPWAFIFTEVIGGGIFVLALAFFRDPFRECPSDTNLLLAPADGRITDIEIVENDRFIEGPALRIGIFLSIFNTHINRMPCNVKVEKITYEKGRYKNAMNPESSRVNESNNLSLTRTDRPQNRLIVRQISGAIARRIVCETSAGEEFAAGDKFGMIKYGSRTELYIALQSATDRLSADPKYQVKCLVQKGDKVKAGLTPLIKYEEFRQ